MEVGGGEPLSYSVAFGLEAGQRGRLHDVDGLRVAKAPSEDGHSFVQGVLNGVGDAMALPKTDEARFGVDIGVLHGGVKVEFHRRSRKELPKAEAEGMVRDEGRRAAVSVGKGQRGGVPHVEVKGGVMEAQGREAAGVGGREILQEMPFRLEPPFQGASGPG